MYLFPSIWFSENHLKNNYKAVAIDIRYYWNLNMCIYNLATQFTVPLSNILTKIRENLDIIKVLILLRLLLNFMWRQTFARAWHFLLAFVLINVLMLKSRFSFHSRWIPIWPFYNIMHDRVKWTIRGVQWLE